MKKIVFLTITALLCASCLQVNLNTRGGKNVVKGKGPVVTRSFDFTDFDAICVNGNADIRFTQADSWEVTLSTNENIFDLLDYKVEDGVLIIQTEDYQTVVAKTYDLTIQAPDLRRIEVNGAGDFLFPAGLRTEGDLEIEVNGAGDLEFHGIVCQGLKIESNGAGDIDADGLDVGTVEIEISGIGDVSVSGKAGEARFDVAGIGDIDARDLEVSGDVHKSTAGIARIRVR